MRTWFGVDDAPQVRIQLLQPLQVPRLHGYLAKLPGGIGPMRHRLNCPVMLGFRFAWL
jgi:hypothetical protein